MLDETFCIKLLEPEDPRRQEGGREGRAGGEEHEDGSGKDPFALDASDEREGDHDERMHQVGPLVTVRDGQNPDRFAPAGSSQETTDVR